MADQLLAYRDRFPTLGRGPYFAAHTLGPMPDTGARRPGPVRGRAGPATGWWPGRAGLSRSGRPPPCWRGCSGPRRVGRPRAQRVGAGRAGAVLLHWSGERSRLVTTDLEFPTCDYLYRAPQTLGAKVDAVPSRDLTVDTERLLEAIDAHTALVAVTHVAFRSSALLDAAAVVARAHEVGALVMLDTYQSAGTVPIDVGRPRGRPAGRRLGQVAAGRPRHRLPVRPPGGGRHPGPPAGRLVRPPVPVRLPSPARSPWPPGPAGSSPAPPTWPPT